MKKTQKSIELTNNYRELYFKIKNNLKKITYSEWEKDTSVQTVRYFVKRN